LQLVNSESGSVRKRWISGITIEHAGKDVILDEVFEYNKFLLGYQWFKHYKIEMQPTFYMFTFCVTVTMMNVVPKPLP